MPPATRRSTQRVGVRTTADASPGLQVVAPSAVVADNPAARAADGLAEILGITQRLGTQRLERVRQKANLSGTLAALEGRDPTEEELKSDSFRLGFEQISQERKLVDVRRELDQRLLSDFDSENGTLQDLDGVISAVFEESYGGLDLENDVDNLVAPEIVRSLEEIRADVLNKFRDAERQKLSDQIEADIFALADDDLARLNSIDYVDLNDRLINVVGGQRTNDIITSVAIDLAVRNGRPELLDALPKSWPATASGHVPIGPRSTARLRNQIRNARIQAENQRLHNERLTEAANEKQLRADRLEAETNTMLALLDGREVTGAVSSLLEDNLLTPGTARTLLNFQASQGDDLSTGEVNNAVAAQLEVDLYTGDATITDVIEAASDGRLGFGNAMKDELSRLLRLSGTVQTVEEQRLATPAARRLQAEIKSLLTPKKDAFGNPNELELQTQAEALRVFAERVGAGEEPSLVRNEVLEAAAQRRQATKGAETAQDSPEELLRLLEAGTISDDEFDRRMTALEASL